ncbi:MAG: hypothetical protein WED07_04055 [Candidatus Freyarchaeum deiterrae]
MKYDVLSIERKNAEILINAFKQKFQPSFEYTSKSGNVKILVLEKFGLNGAYMAATVLFDSKDNDSCIINIVVTGGKKGSGGSFGSQEKMLNEIKRFLQKSGCEKSWKEV